ncbi:MAG: arginine--tRNA ligase, partial [Halobacteriaceae archaeon]
MLRHFRDDVQEALEGSLSELDLSVKDVGVEEPPSNVDAVLASNVAYRLANQVGKSPPGLAEVIANSIQVSAFDLIGSVESAGAYVNFYPSDKYYKLVIGNARNDDYGELPNKDESIVVEHTSANPTGPVHVGRARNPILGDALARILE